MLIFADDSIVYDNFTTTWHLTHKLKLLYWWMVQKKITISPQRSRNICFALNRQEQKPVFINQTIVPRTTETKYLGIVLDKRSTWDCRIKHITKKIASATKQPYWLIRRKWKLKIIDKRTLYTAMIKPIRAYGPPLCSTATKGNRKKMKITRSKLLRTRCSCTMVREGR